MTMLGSGSLEVAKTSTLDPVFYSTRPGYNVVSLNMSQVPTSYYTLSGPNDYGIHSLTPHQGTAWTVGIFLKNGSSASAPRILVKLETWNIALPIDEGVYFLNNVEYPNKYVQINNNNSMLNSGEIIELHQFYGYSYQRWEVEHVLDGYYKIISQYSGLELTAPTGANNDVVTQTTPSSANTHLWKFIKQSDGTYRISPKSNSNYFMAAGAESSAADQDLEIRTTQSDSSDEWRLKLDHLVVEFYYDQGFIKAAKNGTESDAITIANIESNISNVYFHYVARAFQTKFGIQFSIKFIENYTSDADNCPKTTGRAECTCITASNCLLNSFDNPLTNNNAAGFTKSVHCKSLIRLRNNLVVNLPENTVRIAYTGHHACIITDDHNYYAEGLSNYDYPIICMRYPVSPTDTRFVYLMAHEISHFYDLGHHDNGSQCIMDEAKPPININDPNTFWCDDCIATINSNKNKFYIN